MQNHQDATKKQWTRADFKNQKKKSSDQAMHWEELSGNRSSVQYVDSVQKAYGLETLPHGDSLYKISMTWLG